jgi:hypothetical protein
MKTSEQKEMISRMELCQEIILMYRSLRIYRSKRLLQVSMSSATLLAILYFLSIYYPFDFMNSSLWAFCHQLAKRLATGEREQIFQDYQALQNFEFPATCRKYMSELMEHDAIRVSPWQLSELAENDPRHFLFYFSRTLDRCLKTFSLNTAAVTQTFRSLYSFYTPGNQRISFKNEGMRFFSQARELARNFLIYHSKREQRISNNIEIYTTDLYDSSQKLIVTLITSMIESFTSKIFWGFYDRQLFSIPLHSQSTAKLLTLKQKLENDYKLESKKTKDENFLRSWTKIFQLFTIVLMLAFLPMTLLWPSRNLPTYLLGFLSMTPFLIFSFKINNIFLNFFATDEKKTLQRQLNRLGDELKSIRELTQIVEIVPVSLQYSSSSYLLLTPRLNSELAPGAVATILQQSLQSAKIAFNAEGKEVAILSNSKISSSQWRQFKTSFQQLVKHGLNIHQIKKQFLKIVKLLDSCNQISHTRIEEGFLSHSNPESKLYIYSQMPKVLQVLTRQVESLLAVMADLNQITLSSCQPLSSQQLATLIKNFKDQLGLRGDTRLAPISLPPPKSGKSRRRLPETEEAKDDQEEKAPPSAKIIWGRHHVYPHRDIHRVEGAINRYMEFKLPPVCFGNDMKLFNHFKNKSTQMARREKDSQGIKHSTYTGTNFFTGKRETFPANVKLSGSSGNDRVLLKVHTAQGGEMLYEACAFEYNVH